MTIVKKTLNLLEPLPRPDLGFRRYANWSYKFKVALYDKKAWSHLFISEPGLSDDAESMDLYFFYDLGRV